MRRTLKWVPAAALVTTLAMIPAASGANLIRGVSTSNGFRWRPKITSVANGAKVSWKAVNGTHTVTAYKGNWNKNTTISQGQTTSFTFNNNGVFKFRCTLHSTLSNGVCSGMCGKVVVG
jgi:plastocyanin